MMVSGTAQCRGRHSVGRGHPEQYHNGYSPAINIKHGNVGMGNMYQMENVTMVVARLHSIGDV